MLILVFWSPDPLGSFAFYVLYIVWYAFCFNISAIIYQEYPNPSKMAATCMEGIHAELLHAFSPTYAENIITP